MNCRASPEFIVVVLNFVYFLVKVALLLAAFFYIEVCIKFEGGLMFLKNIFWSNILRLSSWSHIVAIGSIALFLAACGDDSSSSTGPEKGFESAEISSSSIEKSESSSSVTPKSSGSSAKSSSSSKKAESSSSDCWNCNVPKEARFNSEIEYGTLTDSRDNQTYRTVKIGEQTWMAENLNYYKDSDLSVKNKSWCYGKNDTENDVSCRETGRLYTWAAAIDSVKLYTDKSLDCGYSNACSLPDTVYGICPPGWHLPKNAEWNVLFDAVGGELTASKVLRSQTCWNSNNGTDAFGFSALPAGGRNGDGDFSNEGDATFFWSASGYSSGDAYRVILFSIGENAILDNVFMFDAFSVRCVKN